MSKKILNIIIDGKPIFNLNDKYNYITLSSKEPEKDQDQGKWLQIDYEKPEEIIKALNIIKLEFGKIDEINIIFNNQKLNMLSYQYDYEFLKNIYFNQTSNLIYLMSLLIPFYNEKIDIKLLVGEFSYYQVHNINWLNSITNFLKSIKKDLEPKILINLFNCK